MQSPLFEPSNLPSIEPPDPLMHALFEDSMLAIIGILVLGVLLLIGMNARGKAKIGLIAMGVSLLLSGGMFVSSTLVTTDREVLTIKANSLVDAVATGDAFSMRPLLSEDVAVETRFASPSGRDQVVEVASSRVPRMVESYSVPEIRVDLPGPRMGRTMVKVRAQSSQAPIGSSWWMIHWERASEESDDWEAVHIAPVWIQGINNPEG
jgi:hypothetical protein